MTDREAILQALFALLQTITDATILRNEALPERIPEDGLIILRDGDPGGQRVQRQRHQPFGDDHDERRTGAADSVTTTGVGAGTPVTASKASGEFSGRATNSRQSLKLCVSQRWST